MVIMPSTSVQISMRSASSAAPTMAAEKSDPPRPIVVVDALARGGDEAAHHRARVSCSSSGRQPGAQVVMRLVQEGNGLGVVGVGDDALARVHQHAR